MFEPAHCSCDVGVVTELEDGVAHCGGRHGGSLDDPGEPASVWCLHEDDSVAAHVPAELIDWSCGGLTPARGRSGCRDRTTHVIDVDARAAHADANADRAAGEVLQPAFAASSIRWAISVWSVIAAPASSSVAVHSR